MASAKERVEDVFEAFAGRAASATGSFWSFGLAILLVLVWLISGPLFDFSEAWQLVINTGTTIITFLMVFLIQHSTNKETRALQLKLNELIAAVEGASNRLIDVEEMTDREIEHIHRRFRHLASTADRLEPGAATSIEKEVEEMEDKHWHEKKKGGRRAEKGR
jgi:low affinity Fe/Cu permease